MLGAGPSVSYETICWSTWSQQTLGYNGIRVALRTVGTPCCTRHHSRCVYVYTTVIALCYTKVVLLRVNKIWKKNWRKKQNLKKNWRKKTKFGKKIGAQKSEWWKDRNGTAASLNPGPTRVLHPCPPPQPAGILGYETPLGLRSNEPTCYRTLSRTWRLIASSTASASCTSGCARTTPSTRRSPLPSVVVDMRFQTAPNKAYVKRLYYAGAVSNFT